MLTIIIIIIILLLLLLLRNEAGLLWRHADYAAPRVRPQAVLDGRVRCDRRPLELAHGRTHTPMGHGL